MLSVLVRVWSAERRRYQFSIIAALVALTACVPAPNRRCGSGEQPMLLAQLYFGRNIGARHGVTDAQFDAFVDQVLTRRFPHGLTHVNATGHWQETNTAVTREQSDVVTLVVPDSPNTHAELEAARRDYMARFSQLSVLLTHQPVCTRL